VAWLSHGPRCPQPSPKGPETGWPKTFTAGRSVNQKPSRDQITAGPAQCRFTKENIDQYPFLTRGAGSHWRGGGRLYRAFFRGGPGSCRAKRPRLSEGIRLCTVLSTSRNLEEAGASPTDRSGSDVRPEMANHTRILFHGCRRTHFSRRRRSQSSAQLAQQFARFKERVRGGVKFVARAQRDQGAASSSGWRGRRRRRGWRGKAAERVFVAARTAAITAGEAEDVGPRPAGSPPQRRAGSGDRPSKSEALIYPALKMTLQKRQAGGGGGSRSR